MLKKRVIPILLLKGQDLVKTTKFQNPKYIGDPINAIKIFNEKKADEIVILSIDKNIRKTIDFDFIEKLAGECFMPITYGGGVRTIDDAKILFSLGIEKISLNNSIINDFALIKKMSDIFGSQSILINVNINCNIFGNYKIYDYLKNKNLDIDPEVFINKCIENGAGEILITLVFNDGCLNGINTNFLSNFNNQFKTPVILNGGINSLENIKEVIENGYDAVGIGAYFVYYGSHKAVLISYIDDKDHENL